MTKHTSSSTSLRAPDCPTTEWDTVNMDDLDAPIKNFFKLSNPNVRDEYDYYSMHHQTLSSAFAESLFLSAVAIPYTVCVAISFSHTTSAFETASYAIILTLLVLLCVATWAVYDRYRRSVLQPKGKGGQECQEDVKAFMRLLQTALFLLLDVIVCFNHVSRTVRGRCAQHSQASWENWHCDAMKDSHTIVGETSIMLMLVPIMYAIAAKGSHFRFALALWSVSMGGLVFSLAYTSATNSVLFVLFYGICSLVILLETRRQNYLMFFMDRHMQQSLKAKERQADEQNAQELRHMIANVAHDLKTPLTAFLGGVDCISQIIAEAKSRPAESTQSPVDLTDLLDALMTCVMNMRNTNAFMLMTINRCIDYTKASKGMQLKPKFETVDLMETLSLPLNCMKDIQQRVCIELEPLAEDICSHVITDRQWLQENVLCLLSNAVKHSSEGSVRLEVTKVAAPTPRNESSTALMCSSDLDHSVLEMRHLHGTMSRESLLAVDPEFLRVEVEDHGIGLSDDAMASLFSPFKQAQRLAGGTGLGLYSLAKRLEALDGRCGVQRRRDGQQGTLFWFEVPYRPDVTARYTALSRSRMSSSQSAKAQTNQSSDKLGVRIMTATSMDSMDGQGKLNVLVVDDSPAILKMTSMMFKRHKHHVATATNGAEAVQMASERIHSLGKPFDVILMDIQMPVMDGFEATRQLRNAEVTGSWFAYYKAQLSRQSLTSLVSNSGKHDRADELPDACLLHQVIIGVSANSDSETAEEAFKMGVDAFIPKPFTLDVFYSTFERVLAAQESSCRHHEKNRLHH